jgi:hypothetical protein
MPKQEPFKIIVSCALALSLLSGPAAYAATTAPTAAPANAVQEQARITTPFSDVKSGHWAEKPIAKLAFQGIINGFQGKFRPNDGVSQQEAVIMTLRFIGKENAIHANGGVVFPTTFKVADYYKPYVLLAFEEGLLNNTEEFKSAEGDPETAWGSRKASREWITKLVIRAIGAQKTADEMSATAASFADRDQISAGYLGYINAAVSLKLVNGVTAEKFDPKGQITRAMIAKLLSSAESQFEVNYEGQAKGIIASLDADSILLHDASGKETAYQLTGDTMYYGFNSEKPSAQSAVELYTNAMVIAKDGNALYVEQLDGDAKVKTVSGTVAEVVPAENKIWLKIGSNFVELFYNDSLILKDASGSAMTLSQLAADSTIDVVQDTFRSSPLAVSIQVKGAPVNKTGQGQFVKAGAGKITIQDSNGAEHTWDLSANASISWQNRILALNDLKAGDSLSYEISNSAVTRITVMQTSAKTVTGQFSSVNITEKTITYLVNGSLEAKFLTDDAQFAIEGMNGVTASDLVKNDSVEITVDDKDMVTQVKVLNRKVETLVGATIIAFEPETKLLAIKDSAGVPHALYLSDKTKIDMNGTAFTLTSAQSLLIKNKKVTIGFTGSSAVSLQFVYKYSGTVTSFNLVSSQMTLALTNGTRVTIPYSSPSVEIPGKASATLADVKVGDSIIALMNIDQDRIVAIQVQRTLQHEVVSVDTAAKKIKLKAADGVITEWPVGSDWSFSNEAGAALTLSQLTAGQTVNVLFAGRLPVALKAITVTSGKVAAVSADRISVTDYKGLTADIPLGTGYRVIRNGVTSTSAAGIIAGERVEVRRDEQDKVLITVNTGQLKTFWKYDAASNEIWITRANTTDNYRFKLSADTVVQQNGIVVPVTSLTNGTQIVLYIFNGKLMEVEKQL